MSLQAYRYHVRCLQPGAQFRGPPIRRLTPRHYVALWQWENYSELNQGHPEFYIHVDIGLDKDTDIDVDVVVTVGYMATRS